MFEFTNNTTQETYDEVKMGEDTLKIPLNISLDSFEKLQSLQGKFIAIEKGNLNGSNMGEAVNDLIQAFSDIMGEENIYAILSFYGLEKGEESKKIEIKDILSFEKFINFANAMVDYVQNDYGPKVKQRFKVKQNEVLS